MTVLSSMKMAERSPKKVEKTMGKGKIACYMFFKKPM